VDFSFTEEQHAVRDLAAQIFAGQATVERIKEVEASRDRFDRTLWAELAKANLLGVALAEDVGGSGLGVMELCLILEQQGRYVAPVPLLSTLVAAMAIAESGYREQRAAWLPAVVAGDIVLAFALAEAGSNDPMRTSVGAEVLPDGRWRLDGSKVSVPAAHLSACLLVPARTREDDLGVFLVNPATDGVTVERAVTTNREIHPNVTLDGVVVDDRAMVGSPAGGATIVERAVERTLVGLCALQVGVAEEATARAAAYSSERIQFGKPLSVFQGVAHKAADAYIDTEAMRATLWQAAWRLAEGEDATMEIEVAKWWAAEGGHRVVHTVQHLHGGLGADVDYPVHRYFLWGKQIEVMLGGASQQLSRLGRQIALAAHANADAAVKV
jgi:alkylation response protein AidB-like acyl-CoA dehydrogenase